MTFIEKEVIDLSNKKFNMTRVMVSGAFDPIHRGHIEHIQKAKELGDWLIVSVNPDEDMFRKKGYCFMPLEERMVIVKEIKGVDEVVASIPDNGTQGKTLEWIRPDIFAKGGDRVLGTLPENEVKVCEELGIKIVYGIGEKLNSSQDLVRNAIRQIKDV